jgi:amino acid transporter
LLSKHDPKEKTAYRRVWANEQRLNFIQLIGVVFFIVCGGAYGIEPLVGAVGSGWAVILILFTPVCWSLPIALMVAELSSAIPSEGGYYVWVRTALGDFWGLQEGWWTICYMVVDLAVYPVLFVNYVAYFYPALQLDEHAAGPWAAHLLRWGIAIAIVAIAFLINWRGARAVGHSSALNLVLVLLPFTAIVLGALLRHGAVGRAMALLANDIGHSHNRGLLTLGLSTMLWNYMGWDNVSTFAEEVNNPQRNYPRAIAVAMVLTVAVYLLPTFAGISVTTDSAYWSESRGWPDISKLIGGDLFASIVALGALFSIWSLFNAQLFYVSRLPYAMALDGWMPAPLKMVSKRTGVPVVSLVLASVMAAILAGLSFRKLVLIDVLLYSAALSLEFVALIALRLKRPEMARPFCIPGGWIAVALVTLAPICCAGLLLISSVTGENADSRQAMVVPGVMISGVALFLARRKRRS